MIGACKRPPKSEFMGDKVEQSFAGNFWSELKRRRVIRVVVLYAIAGWIVIEVASTVLPNLNLPDWTVTLVTALVVLGFIIAIMLAWAFDIGPRGVHRAEDEQASAATAGSPPKPLPDPEPLAVEPEAKPLPAAADVRKSIAVLPFVNMSGDAENEYFSDGISEEILNLLVKLPQLRVASRTSSFIFKGKEMSIPSVAKELGVSTVLEGSVRKSGDRVRITAQLIEVSTDSHLWSETYDREMKDVFAIQDDIATSDPQAYDFYLRGRSYMYTMTRRDYEYAIRMFQRASELDPKYALAYAGTADAYSHMYRYADASKANVQKAIEASEKAIGLDPDSAEARASRGLAMFISENYAEAEREFIKAIELNPNLFEAYYYFGLAYSSQGEFENAVEMYKKAIEVNPADYQSVIFLAQAYSSLGRRHEEMKARLSSLDVIQKHLEINPHDTRALYVSANQFCNVGELDKGLEMAERALGPDEKEPVVLYNVACFFAMKGDSDRSIELLERAVENGWGDRAWLETDSDLDSLREDARFQALLETID
jgi:adenylate cyclase